MRLVEVVQRIEWIWRGRSRFVGRGGSRFCWTCAFELGLSVLKLTANPSLGFLSVQRYIIARAVSINSTSTSSTTESTDNTTTMAPAKKKQKVCTRNVYPLSVGAVLTFPVDHSHVSLSTRLTLSDYITLYRLCLDYQ